MIARLCRVRTVRIVNINELLHSPAPATFLTTARDLLDLEPSVMRLGFFLLSTPVPPWALSSAHLVESEDGVRTVRWDDDGRQRECPLGATGNLVLGVGIGPLSRTLAPGPGGITEVLQELEHGLRDMDGAANTPTLHMLGRATEAVLSAAGRIAGAATLDDLLRRAGLAIPKT